MKKPYTTITTVTPVLGGEVWDVEYPNLPNKEQWFCYKVKSINGRETWTCELVEEIK